MQTLECFLLKRPRPDSNPGAFFSKHKRLYEKTSCGKCVHVRDDGSVVETEGGVEDKQRQKKWRQKEICSFTVESLN